MGRFQSGQMEQTVNLSSVTSVVRIHPFPPMSLKFEHLKTKYMFVNGVAGFIAYH